MKIAFEAVNANKPSEHGSETYLSNLLGSILQLNREDFFYLYIDRPVDERSRFQKDNVIYRHIREVKYLYGACKRTFFNDPWAEFFIAWDLLVKTRPDIYIFNAGSLPPVIRFCKTICMVHDLSVFCIPDCYSDEAGEIFLRNETRSLCAATRVVALSLLTKKDAIRFAGISEEKITVIYPGYNKNIFNTEKNDNRLLRLKSKLKLSEQYVITTGMLHPKKNLVRLAQAFQKVKASEKFGGQLLIVGPDKYRGEEIRRQIKEIDGQCDIIFAGCLPLMDMAELLKGSALFVFPALYEGFGLSMLEAMACGVPVVAANAGALPEVGDDNVLLVDPYNVQEMAQAMAEALNNSGLRNQLRQGALQRAAEFSWDKAARQYLDLFEELRSKK